MSQSFRWGVCVCVCVCVCMHMCEHNLSGATLSVFLLGSESVLCDTMSSYRDHLSIMLRKL